MIVLWLISLPIGSKPGSIPGKGFVARRQKGDGILSVCIYYQLLKDRQKYLESALYNQRHGNRRDAELDFWTVGYIETLIEKFRKKEVSEWD